MSYYAGLCKVQTGRDVPGKLYCIKPAILLPLLPLSSSHLDKNTKGAKAIQGEGQKQQTSTNICVYDPARWSIVPNPTYADGTPCRAKFPDYKKFRLVEWSTEEVPSLTGFAKLPGELRNRIWELSLPDPKLVFLQAGDDGFVIDGNADHQDSYQHMFSCRDSLGVFRLHYHPLVPLASAIEWVGRHTHSMDEYDRAVIKPIYLDGARDVVVFFDTGSLGILNPHEWRHTPFVLDGIQSLAFVRNAGYAWGLDEGQFFSEDFLSSFPSLKSLTCILNNPPTSEAGYESLSTEAGEVAGILSLRHRQRFSLVPMNSQLCKSVKYCGKRNESRESAKWLEKSKMNEWRRMATGVYKYLNSLPIAESKTWDFNCALVCREDRLEWWQSELLYLQPNMSADNPRAKQLAHYTLRPVSRCARDYPKEPVIIGIPYDRSDCQDEWFYWDQQFVARESADPYEGLMNLFGEENFEQYDGLMRLFEEEDGSTSPQEESSILSRRNLELTAWYEKDGQKVVVFLYRPAVLDDGNPPAYLL
ncbi:hypothetical protein HYFRA_00001677 [Hymenoscyphus fraxineus]|uniref:2EXR domain-containing protein n=1 Tax=Hymenoscyphus fraxineus TaxID=746836 RepID=A0A9N9L3T5_9HELO|nr:hypothetical protein HYFRA_00001677 [Hymenoscyphus fraxineus]